MGICSSTQAKHTNLKHVDHVEQVEVEIDVEYVEVEHVVRSEPLSYSERMAAQQQKNAEERDHFDINGITECIPGFPKKCRCAHDAANYEADRIAQEEYDSTRWNNVI